MRDAEGSEDGVYGIWAIAHNRDRAYFVPLFEGLHNISNFLSSFGSFLMIWGAYLFENLTKSVRAIL